MAIIFAESSIILIFEKKRFSSNSCSLKFVMVANLPDGPNRRFLVKTYFWFLSDVATFYFSLPLFFLSVLRIRIVDCVFWPRIRIKIFKRFHPDPICNFRNQNPHHWLPPTLSRQCIHICMGCPQNRFQLRNRVDYVFHFSILVVAPDLIVSPFKMFKIVQNRSKWSASNSNGPIG